MKGRGLFKNLLFVIAIVLVMISGTQVVAQDGDRQISQARSKRARSSRLQPVSPTGVVSGGVVKKISIANTRKIDPDAVRAKLKTKVGTVARAESIRRDVQSIFRMGYFFNVEVLRKKIPGGIELTYRVTEKPSIVEVVYSGNDRLDTDDLEEAAGIRQYTILDYGKLKEAVDKLTKLYEDKGYFLARVKSKVETVKKGEEVKVIFDIKENDKVKVKKITFLGNSALNDNDLKAAMETKEGGYFSWISSSGSYKQEIFDRDIVRLNYLYFNKGYIQVKIDRPQVYVTPDKKSLYITIRVEEGQQYDVGKVAFSGDLLFPEDELFEAVKIDQEKVFVYEVLQNDLKTLQFKYGDLGYAFANIIPKTSFREKEGLLDVTFEVDKGQKVYFGEITVTGNTKTRDKVVRRELRIEEGELYNETRKRRSEENIKRLGYFSEVIFNSTTDPNDSSKLNIDIQVKERSTGTIQIGAGYSTVGGVLLNGQINQTNLFGKGQTLGLSVNISDIRSTYNLGFTEPYFNDTRWTVGFDLYRNNRRLDFFNEIKTGGDIRLGHPIGEYWSTFITYKLDDTEIDLSQYADTDLYKVESVNGLTSSITGSVIYDKRNDRWNTTAGMYGSASLEQAGLWGDRNYTKGLANFRYFKEIFWGLVLRNNINYGFIRVPAGRLIPFNELFLLGGPSSLRGYRWATIGKRATADCCREASPGVDSTPVPLLESVEIAYGGTQQLYYQAELEFMLVKEAQIKGVIFYDIGTADDLISIGNMRQDVGFGFRWFSPIGPLRFEWGFPVDRRSGEPFSNFEFSIGSPF